MRDLLHRVRNERAVELILRGLTYRQVATALRLSPRQLRRIRKTAGFRMAYEELRALYRPGSFDLLPPRVQALELERDAGVRRLAGALGVARRDGDEATTTAVLAAMP